MDDNARGAGSAVASWENAGGLLLGFFCFYVICFGVAWFFGYKKRDQMKRDVVEKQLQRERAQNILLGLE